MNTLKTKKLKSPKLSHNPLFIKFLNWTGDKYTVESILKGIYESFENDPDKLIVKNASLDEDYFKSLEIFRNKFKVYMSRAISSNDVSDEFLAWLSNSFKYIQEDIQTYHNNETRTIQIKDPQGRWLEAIICYNFIMTFNNFGMEIIKVCPICTKFFGHKGKYAKYCSDECKSRGMKK